MDPFLIFHVLVEMFSVIVAWSILTVAWNSRRFLKHSFFLVLGLGYAATGIIDLFHTLAFKGMDIFVGMTSNEPTQFWIAARYVNAVSLLLAPLFLNRKVKSHWLVLSYVIVTIGLLAAILTGWFPTCFHDQQGGLTDFKIVSEFLVCLLIAVAMGLLWYRRNLLDKKVIKLLLWSMALTIAAEVAFTLYIDVYGFFVVLGHLLKLVAFALLYKAVIETGLQHPYDVLFHDLRRSEQRYRKLVSDSPDAIIVQDGGHLLYANQAALQLYGAADYMTLAARNIFDLISSEARSVIADRVRYAAEGQPVPVYEAKIIRLDGQTVSVEVRVSPIKYAGHNATQTIMRDLSARLIAEQNLQQYNEQLRKSRAATLNLLQDAIIAREQAEEAGHKLREEMAERKQAEEALRNSEHRLRLASEAAQLGVFEWDLASDSIYWENDQMYHIFGRTREQGALSGDAFFEHVLDPRDKSEFERAMKEAMQPGKVFYVVCRIHRCNDNERRWIEYWGRFDLAADGSAKRLVGIVGDITDRKLTEKALKQSESRYRELVQNANSAIIRWRSDGAITFFNEYAQSFFGYTAEEIVGQPIGILVPEYESTGADLRGLIQDIITNPDLYSHNINENICKDGRRVWMAWTNRTIWNEADQVDEIFAVGIDITARKEAEDALRESEQRLRAAAQAAHFGTYDVDLETNTLYWSPEMRSILGLPPDAPVPAVRKLPDFIHPQDVKTVRQMFRKAFDPAGNGAVQNEHRIIRPDGTLRWVMLRGQVEFNEQNGIRKPIRSRGILLDITERKQVEEALRQSREDLNRAQAVGGIGSWRLDLRDNELTWSEENYRIFGIPKETGLTYELFLESIHPDDRDYVSEQWQAALAGEPYDIEHRILAEGRVKWVRQKAYLEFSEQGELLSGFGITQDITRRRRMQEKLRAAHDDLEARVKQRTAELAETVDSLEMEVRQRIAAEKAVQAERRHFREVLDSLPAYVILLTSDYKIQFANRFFEEHFGTPDETKPCYEFLHGRSEPCDYCVVPEVLRTGEAREWEWQAPDGQDYFVRDFLFTDRSRSTLIMEMGIDITERKQAQERIRLTNILLELFTKKTSRKEYLDAVIRVIHDWTKCQCIGIRLLDDEGNIPYESWIGFDDQFMATEGQISLHDDPCLCIRAITQNLCVADNSLQAGQSSFHSGDTLDFLTTLSEEDKKKFRGACMRHGFASLALVPIRYRGDIIGAIHLADKEKNKLPVESVEFLESMAMLVGEAICRFNVEESLQQSRSRLLEAQRIAHIGNWAWDLKKGRLFWSDEIFRMFGLKVNEIVPSFDIFMTYVLPEDRSKIEEAIERAKKEGSYVIDHRIIKPDGTERTLHEIAEVIYDIDGNPVKMTGTMHDITEQKMAEKAIREHQQALRAMAAELQLAEERQRRQIAQDLHDSIGPILAFSTRELRTLQKRVSDETAANLEDVTEKIDIAIQQARTLSFDLSPSLLYDLGLEVAVEDLVDRFADERRIQCSFRTDPESKPLTEDVKIILYRSVRELLINAAKHAEPSRVQVSIERLEKDICIRVEDDGMGFDVKILDENSEKTRGFGLFSIRERLNHIGGDFTIESARGKGTVMILTAPMDLTKNKGS